MSKTNQLMKVLAVIALMNLSSCGACERIKTNVTGELTYKCSKSGVEYAQADSGLAVHVDKNGKPVVCDK